MLVAVRSGSLSEDHWQVHFNDGTGFDPTCS